MPKVHKPFSILSVVCLFLMLVLLVTSAQSFFETINSPEGGKILYGVVHRATNRAAGLASVLRAVHSK